MNTTHTAKANPEKRLFISLLTRDISMIAAFLDLIDNSVNAAIENFASQLETAEDYVNIHNNKEPEPKYDIRISFSKEKIQIVDNAPGISLQSAKDDVFKFGRSYDEASNADRLSVYGLGLKRAFFKLGNKVNIVSDHSNGGFELDLNVSNWSKISKMPWEFDVTSKTPAEPQFCGTNIEITELYQEVQKRLEDGVFESQLVDSVSKTYTFFLTKFVSIFVNGKKISPSNLKIGSNLTTENFKENEVSCTVTAGLGIPEAGSYRDRNSGWFVFCNGRTIISADKSPLTGWNKNGLPIFQPKHRPFLGIVHFASKYADQLPWDTTKSGINEDSELWQKAKQLMVYVGKSVTAFLDSRYTDEGTEIAQKELANVAKGSIDVLSIPVNTKKTFEIPKPRLVNTTTTIQFSAKINEVREIKNYFSESSMSNSEVGRRTFYFFLENEVGED